jgi:hypothetical protein
LWLLAPGAKNPRNATALACPFSVCTIHLGILKRLTFPKLKNSLQWLPPDYHSTDTIVGSTLQVCAAMKFLLLIVGI